jgi:hypothetical protein
MGMRSLALAMSMFAGLQVAEAANPAASDWARSDARVLGKFAGTGKTRIRTRYGQPLGWNENGAWGADRAYLVARHGDQIGLTWYGANGTLPGRATVFGKVVSTKQASDGATTLKVEFPGLKSGQSIAMGRAMTDEPDRYRRTVRLLDRSYERKYPKLRARGAPEFDLLDGVGQATLTFTAKGGLDIRARDVHPRTRVYAQGKQPIRQLVRELTVPRNITVRTKMKLEDPGDRFANRDFQEALLDFARMPGFNELPND